MGTARDTHFAWTDENVATAKRLYWRGLSASQIAKELGGHISRNAVIGKLHRLGVARDSDQTKAALQPKRATQVKVHMVRHARPSAASGPEPEGRGPGEAIVLINAHRRVERLARDAEQNLKVPEIGPNAEDMQFARPWIERGARECKWPFGLPEDALSCCRPVERSGYCGKHAAVAFRGVTAAKAKSQDKAMTYLIRRCA